MKRHVRSAAWVGVERSVVFVAGVVVAFAVLTGCGGADSSSSGGRGRRGSGATAMSGAGAGAGDSSAGTGSTATAGSAAPSGVAGGTGSGTGAGGADAAGKTEVCGNDVDENGDGSLDEDCGCDQSDKSRSCYVGPDGTKGVGLCKAGKQECLDRAEFDTWAACEGAVLPEDEVCDDDEDNDCDGKTDEGCEPPPPPPPPPPPTAMPEKCSDVNLTHVTGVVDCAPNQAVFMMDDGAGPNFICCPLPAADILLPPAVSRAGQCGANEVITGASATSVFNCTPINTARYLLGPAMVSCYFGTGAAGGGGVSNCAGHPTSFSVLANNYFGSDGCSSQPYGALFVKQTSKYCKDQLAAQLQYAGTVAGDPAAGTPVDTFME